MTKFRVLHHNNCFDGACSAAVFTKLHRECVGGADGYEYVGLAHAPNRGGVEESAFGPGENAIVDFKYSSSPRLTWWFDHHESAFVTEADREKFERGQRGELAMRQFFDPNFVSCTGWIAKVGRDKFGFDTSGMGELLRWADIIDGARFESAEQAVMMPDAAIRLAMVIENAESGFIPRVIPLLTEMPLEAVLAEPFVQDKVAPLWARNLETIEWIRERAELEAGVIYFDLTDKCIEGLSKFIPYYLYPEATYTIALTRSRTRTKISVGTSPWTTRPAEELVNLAQVCERFGGGGHARVGAISFGADEVERARELAGIVVAELRGGK